MKVNSLKHNDPCYPKVLQNIHSAPKELFWVGENPKKWDSLPKVAVVGSRKITPYGKEVTRKLSGELTRTGIAIVSGLAFGVDAVAHQAVVDSSGVAIVVLPTPLDKISPVSNQHLARKILEQGGTLITEYPNGSEVHVGNFVARNRIVSGLCDGLLITEAAVNSGSLHTARFALEQGKTVMAVPGNITSPVSEGCNNLIKSGAIPVTCVEDIFFALNIKPAKEKIAKTFRGNPQEQQILALIEQGISDQEELATSSDLDGAGISRILTMLEINGHIRPVGAGQWILS